MRPPLQMLSILAFGGVLVTWSDADAQTIPSPYSFIENRQEVGPFVGYMDADPGRFGYGPSGGLWYGVRYGLQLSGPMALEGTAGLVSGTRDVIDPNQPEGSRVVGEADALITTIDARLRFSATGDRAWHRLSPFLFLGAGVAFDVAQSAEADSLLEDRDVFDFGTSFFGSVGLGTRLFLSDHFAVRADGSFSLWRLKTPPGFSDADRTFDSVDNTQWVRGLGATFTLLYRW